jgi:hypothetical protein
MTAAIPFENLDPLLPIDFFSIQFDVPFAQNIPKKSFLTHTGNIPETHIYLEEEKFADVSLFWNQEGIFGEILVQKEFQESNLPDYENGDSVEIFIDTRDMKKAGFATRFCHHFVFLAHPVQGIKAQEVTKFRSEDTHPLCDESLLLLDVKYEKKSYSLAFFIPSQCLLGYEPDLFPRLGFTYKINRYKGPSQHLSISSMHFDIMQNPSLWASINLTKI